MRALRSLSALGTFALALSIGSCSSNGSSNNTADAGPTPIPCDSTAIGAAMDSFAASDVAIHIESAGDAHLAIVGADLGKYLGKMWGSSFTPQTNAPDFSHKLTIWLSTSPAAQAKAGATPTDGYVIRRIDAGGSTVIVVTAPDATNLAYGAYALLESLGARFFHLKQTFVPALGGVRVPKGLSITRTPLMAQRGLQPHTLHTIELMQPLIVPSAQNLADAKLFIDWLVATGQNYVQWPLLSESHMPWAKWKPHAQAILDYAHLRGVRVGAVVQTWGGSSLQNNFVLVDDPTKGLSPMESQLDQLMQLNWDVVELALGEFVSADPQNVIDWINHAYEYLNGKFPKLEINVQNHVGNYPNLYVMYKGTKYFFYHLPQFTDTGIGQTVHTIGPFDLYRNWATYGHPDFHLQHDYAVQEIATRRVKYFPESAYWISADSDVPLFLPMFVYSRWNDIHSLTSELATKKLPPLTGHVMFSSGHEWGYWMTDYMTAKMLWQPDATMDSLFGDYAGAYGSCQKDVGTALSTLVTLQNKYLFDERLLPYVQAENTTVDLAYAIGQETHSKRVPFETVWSMTEADKQTFEKKVLGELEAFDAQVAPIADAFTARCAGADAAIAPWCKEVLDGVTILRMRAQHADHLYRAVLAKSRSQSGEDEYQKALTITTSATDVINRRVAGYRWDTTRLIEDFTNPTIYNYGYLRPAHTMCYWQRAEQQARGVMDNAGTPVGFEGLPSCQD